jgi:spore germination protein
MLQALAFLGVAAQLSSAFSLLGYYTGDDDSLAMLKASKIDAVAFDAFNYKANGVIIGSDYPLGLAYAKQNNVYTYATVSNYGKNDFSTSLGHTILSRTKVRAKAVLNAVKLVHTHGYDGLNIDFESIPAGDRPHYTAFITELATGLHALNLTLMISVPAVEQDNPSDSWAGAYDYPTLGGIVDVMQVMTYDENGPWGSIGPVAGLDWVTQCIAYTVSVVPKHKISQGLNAYGYDWTSPNVGVSISYKDFPALIAQVKAVPVFDTTTSSMHFSYELNGKAHTVWYDNNQTVYLKVKEAVHAGVQGVSMWSIGQEDITFWNAVRLAL